MDSSFLNRADIQQLPPQGRKKGPKHIDIEAKQVGICQYLWYD